MSSRFILTLGVAILAVVVEVAAGDDPTRLDPTAAPRGKTDLIDDTQANPLVLAEYIYDDEHAPTPQCHATTIAETPGGLVAAWFGGQHEKNPDVGIWVSRKVGDAWTAPVEVMNGVQHSTLRYPCWNPVLFQQPGGPLHLFAKCGPSPDTWWGTHQSSADHGVTWTRAMRLPAEIDGPVRNKPVLLSDGTLLCGSSTEYGGWRVHFELTRDWGLTWDRVGPINDGKEFGAIQPTILVHRPEDQQPEVKVLKSEDRIEVIVPGADSMQLQALCRHEQRGQILSTRSDDLGRTWSPLTPTMLPNPNSGIDAVTLQDGTHLLIYNHTRKGRSPLNVAVSRDGDDWQAAYVLESEPGEYSYPAVIQSADGLVHITYTWKRTRVKHVVLDPAKLRPQPIVDGEWPQ